jgi:hypothetical protein
MVNQAAIGDANGNVLVVAFPGDEVGFGSNDLVGRWLDGSGAFLTDWFLITTGVTNTSTFAVHSMIGGGAAVAQDDQWHAGVWRAVLPSGGLPQAPPDWLASRLCIHFPGRRLGSGARLAGRKSLWCHRRRRLERHRWRRRNGLHADRRQRVPAHLVAGASPLNTARAANDGRGAGQSSTSTSLCGDP